MEGFTMDIRAMAKAAGLLESDLKGLSLDKQIKLITDKMKEEKEALEAEQAKEYIDNYKTQVPKLKDFLEKPFEIYVNSVGQRKTPTIVQVVGYNSNTQNLIVLFSEKLYQIEQDKLIKSSDELTKEKTRAKAGTGKKKTK
jgi:hypothetical protein